ncbi:hypothetical protein KAR91_43015 [Candidatus Pacearchaeota archaeon]|nr:hypothetical protein [Candidatus Pacearchaeota archaeon]
MAFVSGVIWNRLQPKIIDIPSEVIIEQLYKAENFSKRQEIAKQIYVGNYVEWKITINEILFQEKGPGTIMGTNVKAIFKNSKVILPYKKGMTLVVKGRIAKLEDNATIAIDKCKIVGLK